MEIRIGIQQAVTMVAFEQMLSSVLNGDYTLQYAEQLAHLSTRGEARVKKIRTVINRMAICNPLLQYMKEHRQEVEMAMKNSNDKKLVYMAVACATYPFAFQALSIMGKYFHVQDEITTGLVKAKLSEIYGSVRTLEIGLLAIMPMLMEAGFIERKKTGVYSLGSGCNYSEFAKTLYKKAFLVNNPSYTEETMDDSNPFFEFIR